MFVSKAEIREEIRRRQAQYDLADIQRAGLRIGASLEILLTRYFQPRLVMCYVSTRDEAPTHDVIRSCLKRGQRICVPCLDRGTRQIVPSELESFSKDLERGYSGILEPRDTCRRPVEANDIDYHLIPGVAFDPNGFPIGRGSLETPFYLGERSDITVQSFGEEDLSYINHMPDQEKLSAKEEKETKRYFTEMFDLVYP